MQLNILVKLVIFLCFLTIALPSFSSGFKLFLSGGELHGPGNLGYHKLQDGSIQQFIVTAPLEGHVEMQNNGANEPNIYAEKLHVTSIDGKLSDGTLINENVDVGFVLEIDEPETREKVKLFVTSISDEKVTVDEKYNLTFALTAGFDPGLPEFVVKMPVEFVTGVATVPQSIKTLRNQPGGSDNAGIYSSGYKIVGRLGDFDNDGFLDGVFILGGNSPYDLIIAEGDPILVIRPFTSDIPVSAKNASIYTLKGIINNYPEVINNALIKKRKEILEYYHTDLLFRLDALSKNYQDIKRRKSSINTGVNNIDDRFKNVFMKNNKEAELIIKKLSYLTENERWDFYRKGVDEFLYKLNENLNILNNL